MGRVDLFISILKSFISTPWVLGGREPMVALDCIGMVVCGLKELDIEIVDGSDYKSSGEFVRLVRFMLSISEKVGTVWKDAEPGDILLFGVDESNNHVGVLTYDKNFIHCTADPTYRVCLEEPLSGNWKMAVHSVYRIKGLKDV